MAYAQTLHNSIFSIVFKNSERVSEGQAAILGGITGSQFSDIQDFESLPIVIFDFETTGLVYHTDRIIEVGAIKFVGRKEVARFSQLINPQRSLSEDIIRITGITDDMLRNAPTMDVVLHDFHDFMRGAIGIAHNAEFDCNMLIHESKRLGVVCDYTVFCTLKMARKLVKSERKNLDALAAHYNLPVETRHRSIDDIILTAGVLWNMLDENPQLKQIKDFREYQEVMLKV